MKKIIALLLSLLLVFSFAGCTEKADEPSDEPVTEIQISNPVATITVKDYGTIKVELYYDVAPNTVLNFISLANSGFYDGLIFHRVIENFMIQGGDPEGTGMGGPDYSIKGEFTINGFENNLSHKRGVISMARAGYSYDSAGSQFFICQVDYPSLDGNYASFGMVLDGMDVVDAIAAVETNYSDKPLEDVVIESVVVDTHGQVYDDPVIIVN